MIKAVFSASLLQSPVSHDLLKSFVYTDSLFKKQIIINIEIMFLFQIFIENVLQFHPE